ncbi:hypothetical protein Q5752_000989 [Cryptotrichosporon argae]
MSTVAQTKTEITEKPSKLGVTVANNRDEQEADVQRKVKLWGVLEAFRSGRMPDNQQIDKVLDYAVHHSPVDLDRLSPEGRVLVDDVRDIVETMRAIVIEKNADELFQNAVWQSYHGDISRAKQDNAVPVGKDQVKEDANQAAAHLRVLITLFITNGEFRKIVNDLGLIGRDLFATAASKAADKARPDQHQLDQVDKEAPSNQWVGADGKTHGTDSTPELQLKGPNGAQIHYNPKDAPGEAKLHDGQGNQIKAGEAYNKYQDTKQDAKNAAVDQATNGTGDAGEGKNKLKDTARSAVDQAAPHAKDVANARDPNASLTEQKDQMLGRAQEKVPDDADDQVAGKKEQARGKVEDLKNKIPEQHREKVAGAIDSTKDTLNDAFPEERRDQFIYRLKKVVVECQQHKDYQQAMSWLLDTLDSYKGHAKHVANKGANAAQDANSDPALTGAVGGFVELLERFANGRSVSHIQDAIDQLYTDARNDDELRAWWSKADDYIHRALLEPGFILDDSSDEEARQLKESGKYFFQDKYRDHWNRLWDEVKAWFIALADDPLNHRFGEDWKRLVKDLLFDHEGNMTFKPKLWADIRHTVLPQLIRQIGYVPIPRAEYSDEKIDLVIENLVLSGPNLFPNVVVVENHNYFKFSPYDNINKTLDTNHHRFRVGLSQIQADIRDVQFSFRKHSGFPKISDHGLADVVISGQGISVDIEIETVENKRDSVFKVNAVNTKIDNLAFALRQTKHDLLYKFIKAAATTTIKKAISVAVETALRSALEHLDDQLVEVRNNMEEAKRSDETTRTQALKDLYARKKNQAADKKHAADKRGSTFRLVADRDSQINPELSGDHGKSISKRIWKTEDLANSGKEWRSPAFDLLDSRHPAVTGTHHPEAQQGAGAGQSLSSKIGGADSKSAERKAEAKYDSANTRV